MNNFRIRVFLSVAKHLSFTKASTELNISQPAISKHISEIELKYKIRLFERTRGRVSLTWHGQIFANYAEKLLAQYTELMNEMNSLANKHKGQLVISAANSFNNYVLPEILAKYLESYPSANLVVNSLSTQNNDDLAGRYRIDVAITDEDIDFKLDLEQCTTITDDLVLVCSSKISHPSSVSLEKFKELPLAIQNTNSNTRSIIEKGLKRASLKLRDLNVVITLDTTEAIKRFVISSPTYAIVPRSSVAHELKQGELQVVEIQGLTLERRYNVLIPTNHQNQMVSEFVKFLEDSCGEVSSAAN